MEEVTKKQFLKALLEYDTKISWRKKELKYYYVMDMMNVFNLDDKEIQANSSLEAIIILLCIDSTVFEDFFFFMFKDICKDDYEIDFTMEIFQNPIIGDIIYTFIQDCFENNVVILVKYEVSDEQYSTEDMFNLNTVTAFMDKL